MISTDSLISFMCSTVHISVDNKINISFFADTYDLDVMLYSGITEIAVLCLAEAEYLCHFSISRGIRPQISLLNKDNDRSIVICHIFYIFVPDAKDQTIIFKHRKLRIKYLICRTLEIQKKNSRIISHSVKFFYIINLQLSLIILRRNLIFQCDAGCGFIDIVDHRNAFSVKLRLQSSPAYFA